MQIHYHHRNNDHTTEVGLFMKAERLYTNAEQTVNNSNPPVNTKHCWSHTEKNLLKFSNI